MWREADHSQMVLRSVYASHSWKLTAPMRALHLKDNGRKSILALIRFLRKIPWVGSLMNATSKSFPGIWLEVAARVKNPIPVESPLPAPASEQSAVVVAAPEDEQHFLGLFQHELSRRQPGKTETH